MFSPEQIAVSAAILNVFGGQLPGKKTVSLPKRGSDDVLVLSKTKLGIVGVRAIWDAENETWSYRGVFRKKTHGKYKYSDAVGDIQEALVAGVHRCLDPLENCRNKLRNIING